eukprot:11169420-Lingulodinium_polyedra.AAC.1
MHPRELVDSSADADIFGNPWDVLGATSWSEMCDAVGINTEALSGVEESEHPINTERPHERSTVQHSI